MHGDWELNSPNPDRFKFHLHTLCIGHSVPLRKGSLNLLQIQTGPANGLHGSGECHRARPSGLRTFHLNLALGYRLGSAKNRDDTSVSGPVIVSSRGVYGCSSLAFVSERVDYSVLVIR